MGRICLSVLWIGCVCLGVIRSFSSEGRPRVARSCPPSGLLWPPWLISRKEKGIVVGSSLGEIVAFKAIVRHARAILSIGKSSITSSGWASLDIDRDDPVEVALAARVHYSATTHVVGIASKKYVGPWNKFMKWCGERLSKRCPFPASDFTVALYLQSVADGAKTFAPMKSHSAAIAFFQKESEGPLQVGRYSDVRHRLWCASTRILPLGGYFDGGFNVWRDV